MTVESAWRPAKELWRRMLAHRLAAPAKRAGAFLLSRTDFTAWATLRTGRRLGDVVRSAGEARQTLASQQVQNLLFTCDPGRG